MKYLIAFLLTATGLYFGYLFGVMPIVILDLSIAKSIMWAFTGCAVFGCFCVMAAIALES